MRTRNSLVHAILCVPVTQCFEWVTLRRSVALRDMEAKRSAKTSADEMQGNKTGDRTERTSRKTCAAPECAETVVTCAEEPIWRYGGSNDKVP